MDWTVSQSKTASHGLLPRPGTQSEIIVALDVPDFKAAERLVEELVPVGIRWFKVGMRLFYAEGPSAVTRIQEKGGRVFVDLKLHDIPNTVAQATESLVRNGVSFLNVHCLGGKKMMAAAAESARNTADEMGLQGDERPIVIGVTILTSHSEESLNRDLAIPGNIESNATRLAVLAKESGLNGVVCSPLEAATIRNTCGETFLRVTPGIRPASAAVTKDDQTRILTPAEALHAGASHLVIGRPIIDAESPQAAAQAILEEVETWKTSSTVQGETSR